MKISRALICLWSFFSATSGLSAQTNTKTDLDFAKTVVPITETKFVGVGLEGKFGTGFCLDPDCRFVATNYHVAAIDHPKRVKGQPVIARYLGTGPKDEGATLQLVSNEALAYNPARDVAILELNKPLPEHNGIGFSLEELRPGQDVEIYAYPKESISPIRTLLKFDAKFREETDEGLLAFDYALSDGKRIRGGASGGIIVDMSQRIIGILSGVGATDSVALAVSTRSLAEFVRRIQPTVALKVFSDASAVPPIANDYNPKLSAPTMEVLHHRQAEPLEVRLLRAKAHTLTDSIRNFVAVQSLEWGKENNEPSARAAYEVQVEHDSQTFREYPDGKKELHEIPPPRLNTYFNPSDQWSDLPSMVGIELGLKIEQAPHVIVNGQQIKVFRYRADVEDGACKFRSSIDYMAFSRSKTVTVACYGEVWTDQDTNILRISEHYDTPRPWSQAYVVVTYGWIKKRNSAAKLLPLTLSSEVQLGNKTYWCRGQFTNYREYGSEVRILTASDSSVSATQVANAGSPR
jgi:hypothetical protein